MEPEFADSNKDDWMSDSTWEESADYPMTTIYGCQVRMPTEKLGNECKYCYTRYSDIKTLQDHIRSHTGKRPYICITCGMTFQHDGALRDHSNYHLTDPVTHPDTYPCGVCSENLYSMDAIKEHILRLHNVEWPVPCDLCTARFTSKLYLTCHRNTFHSNDRNITCTICSQKFSSKIDQYEHMKSVHDFDKSFKCSDCEKKYTRKFDLQLHVLQKHSQDNIDQDRNNEVNSSPSCLIQEIQEMDNVLPAPVKTEEITEFKQDNFTVSDIQFINLDEIKNEFIGLKNDNSNEELMLPNEEENRENIIEELPSDIKYTTKHCNKKRDSPVTRKSNKRKRVQVRTRVYTCSYCKKTFSGWGHWKDHEYLHTGQKPYLCYKCGISFSYIDSFRKHSKIHANVRARKIFCCDICGKSLRSRDSLIEHMRLHCSELRYACNQCDARLLTSRRLYLHRQLMHNPTAKKTGQSMGFNCRYCEKSYLSSNALRNHEKMHAGDNRCDICDKNLSSKNSLTEHKRVHSNECSYACVSCDSRFKSESQLNYHKKTFHGKNEGTVVRKPYTHFCSLCDRKYRTINALHFHMRKHGENRNITCSECSATFKEERHLALHRTRIHVRKK